MSSDIKVAIVEDHKRTRELLATLIGATPGYRTVGQFIKMEDALARFASELPDVALLDIDLPGMSGIEGVREIRARQLPMQILMLTVYADNDHVFEAVCAGASGYLLKDTPPAKLLEAIRELHDGGAPMSPEIARKVVTMFQKVAPPKRQECQLSTRELEILKLLADGHSYKTAAYSLTLSLDTIRFHIRNIYEKLHVHSKSEAVLKALRSGIIQ
jgi:DNA-binding NarL/FixJ family response regulator